MIVDVRRLGEGRVDQVAALSVLMLQQILGVEQIVACELMYLCPRQVEGVDLLGKLAVVVVPEHELAI
ncbi:hypothetical protein SDC9_137652 [bioreactor metagenome]|uniref:Uncharacterized protein n=1 Tax=bioreactor metagenome TaxID=1076179 RepID=A0A645DMP7_9ZZZZ